MDSVTNNIYQRIHSIQSLVGYVKKDATVGFGNSSYSAVTHDAVLARLREHLINEQIIVVPRQRDIGETLITGETAKGKSWVLFRAMYDIAYVCADKPEDFLIVSVEGHGEDINDKADGKALSYACKMANLKLFLLATGDNDEERMEQKSKPLPFADYKTEIAKAKSVDEVKTVARKYTKMVDEKVWAAKDIDEAGNLYHARIAEFDAAS